jgi:hypothetical protein
MKARFVHSAGTSYTLPVMLVAPSKRRIHWQCDLPRNDSRFLARHYAQRTRRDKAGRPYTLVAGWNGDRLRGEELGDEVRAHVQ